MVEDVADANGSMTEGVVLVERAVSRDGSAQTNVSAKFMRLSAPTDPDLAEQVVGAKLDLPAIGSCRLQAPTEAKVDRRTRSALGTIELIDVGDVSLRAGSSAMSLAVRAFPDVGELVSGMFYTSPDTTRALPAGTLYTLEGTGSGAIDRFTIEADAPPAPEQVRVAGTPLTESISLDPDAPATVEWTAGVATPRKDLVLVDLSVPSGAAIRCAFNDEGSATLPSWVLKSKELGPLPATATLAVHRIRQRSFTGPGLDTGEMRFDLSVMGHVVIAPAASPRPQP